MSKLNNNEKVFKWSIFYYILKYLYYVNYNLNKQDMWFMWKKFQFNPMMSLTIVDAETCGGSDRDYEETLMRH